MARSQLPREWVNRVSPRTTQGIVIAMRRRRRGSGQSTASGVILHATVRGVVAAMCMSGMRSLTVRLGLLKLTPPEMVVAEQASGLIERIPEPRREAAVELLHWAYGAVGGGMFGLLPDRVRLQPWAGPVYGAVLWLGFESMVSPALGLGNQRRARTAVERVALTVDHLLYGAVLAELRRKPQQ